MSLHIVPLDLATANDAVQRWHRHHRPVIGYKWALGVQDDAGQLRGVAIASRPVARFLDNGRTAEVTRLATDGAPNACSCLYGAMRRVAREMGYERIVTYTLVSEPGTSLRAAGWTPSIISDGGSWSVPSRQRIDKHPLGHKQRWDCWLLPEERRAQQGRPQFGAMSDTGTLLENIG